MKVFNVPPYKHGISLSTDLKPVKLDLPGRYDFREFGYCEEIRAHFESLL